MRLNNEGQATSVSNGATPLLQEEGINMRYLVLVKHSLPHIVPTLPAHRWYLSEEGHLRCQALADKLAVYSPGCILSSK
jgi:hypothetical protein